MLLRLLFRSICILACILLASCTEEFKPETYACLKNGLVDVGTDGGIKEVYFYQYAPLVLISENLPSKIDERDNYMSYIYIPKIWEFSSSDIVNLIPSYRHEESDFTVATQKMIDSGATILTDSDYFDCEWFTVRVMTDKVVLDIKQNQTGEYRETAMVFSGFAGIFFNVILIRQKGDS